MTISSLILITEYTGTLCEAQILFEPMRRYCSLLQMISRERGSEYLLQAISLLNVRGKRVKLMVVGKDHSAPYKRMSEQLGVAETGRFYRGLLLDIEKYYGAADIFVLPTLYDPFSNACLEAFGSGLPVITTAQNGFSELIEDGLNGFVS